MDKKKNIAYCSLSLILLIVGIILIVYYVKSLDFTPKLDQNKQCPNYDNLPNEFKISFSVFKNWNNEITISELNLKIAQKCPTSSKDLLLYKNDEIISSTESSYSFPNKVFSIRDCHNEEIFNTQRGGFSFFGDNIDIFNKSNDKIGRSYSKKVIYYEASIFDNDDKLIWNLQENEFYSINIKINDNKHELSRPEFVIPFIMKTIYNDNGWCQKSFSILLDFGIVLTTLGGLIIILLIYFNFKNRRDERNGILNLDDNPEVEINLIRNTNL